MTEFSFVLFSAFRCEYVYFVCRHVDLKTWRNALAMLRSTTAPSVQCTTTVNQMLTI